MALADLWPVIVLCCSFVVCLAWPLIAKRCRRQKVDEEEVEALLQNPLGPYEVAHLVGGKGHVVNVCAAALLQRGVLVRERPCGQESESDNSASDDEHVVEPLNLSRGRVQLPADTSLLSAKVEEELVAAIMKDSKRHFEEIMTANLYRTAIAATDDGPTTFGPASSLLLALGEIEWSLKDRGLLHDRKSDGGSGLLAGCPICFGAVVLSLYLVAGHSVSETFFQRFAVVCIFSGCAMILFMLGNYGLDSFAQCRATVANAYLNKDKKRKLESWLDSNASARSNDVKSALLSTDIAYMYAYFGADFASHDIGHGDVPFALSMDDYMASTMYDCDWGDDFGGFGDGSFGGG